jgi:GTP cyclohydrolase I
MHTITEDVAAQFEDGPILTAECKRLIANSALNILYDTGEDPERDGLRNTPGRVACMFDELLVGYSVDPIALLNNALFDVEYDEMVVVTDIDFYSLCEHHQLPIVGKAHVAYLPDKKVVGLSKIPRVVEAFARRLQIQERMTRQIADLLDELIRPKGVAVVVDAAHMCVMMRGAKKANAQMRTSALIGAFRDNPKTRAEFMNHIEQARGINPFG